VLLGETKDYPEPDVLHDGQVAGEEMDGGLVDQLHSDGVEPGLDGESSFLERLVDLVAGPGALSGYVDVVLPG
jgi:hypothetical protein